MIRLGGEAEVAPSGVGPGVAPDHAGPVDLGVIKEVGYLFPALVLRVAVLVQSVFKEKSN